jgi:hypothetical protein
VEKKKILTLPGLQLRPLGQPVAIPTTLSITGLKTTNSCFRRVSFSKGKNKKVKLSLSPHEDVLGSGGIAPSFFTYVIKGQLCTPASLPPGKEPSDAQ